MNCKLGAVHRSINQQLMQISFHKKKAKIKVLKYTCMLIYTSGCAVISKAYKY